MTEEIHAERVTPRLAPARVRRASWGAIFAGMFVTIVLQVMLTLLGVGVGIVSIQSAEQQNAAQAISTGSGIWLLITGLISIWIGSCVAGRLSGGPRRADGMLHGIVSWSVATVAMVGLLATTLGAVLGGTAAFVGGALTSRTAESGGQGALAALENQIKGAFPQAGALLPPTGRTEGQQVPGQLTAMAQQDGELAAALARMEHNGGAAKSPGDRDQVVSILTSKHNLNPQEAQNLVTQWDQQFQQVHAQAGQKAKQVGTAAARGVEQGALWGFVALILGLIVAAWGGWAGTASLPRPTEAATVMT